MKEYNVDFSLAPINSDGGKATGFIGVFVYDGYKPQLRDQEFYIEAPSVTTLDDAFKTLDDNTKKSLLESAGIDVNSVTGKNNP